TWWDHRGTCEWVERDFVASRKVSAVEVYWFDDTAAGACRVPQSWQLLYKQGSQWKPVAKATEYGTRLNTYNRVRLQTTETTALRIEAQLQPGFSGGILGWKVAD